MATPIVLASASAESGRNLAVGVFLVLAALPVAGLAFIWAPREAFVAISTALLISLLVFIFFQLRLVSQRNGLFALLAAGLLVTLAVPVLVKVGASSSEWAEWLVQIKNSQRASPAAAQGVVAVERSAPEVATVAVQTQPAPASAAVTAKADAPKSPAASIVSVPSGGGAGGDKTEKATRSEDPTRPSAVDPEETAAKRTTRLATEEAIKRYPNLGKVGSREHSRYIQTFNEFERLHKHEFFADPAWPLNLAELLAERDGWKRADLPAVPAAAPGPAAREEAPRRSERTASAMAPAAAEAALVSAEPAAPPTENAPVAADAPVGKPFGLDLPEADPTNPNSRLVAEALAEVKRRYPLVAQVGTMENRLFVEAYQEYDRLRPDFFENPRWPVRLVDLVAKREGWRKADAVSGTEGR